VSIITPRALMNPTDLRWSRLRIAHAYKEAFDMAEKIARLGIRGNRDFILYVKGGAVWRVRKMKEGSSARKPKPERISEPKLFPMDDDYIYFVDRDGDVSRASRESPAPKATPRRFSTRAG
jgi:hypothetical protein